MANYATLKAAIQQVVKTNGNNEITGALLQQSLLAMINSLGVGYQYVGIATPATNPGTPDQNVFYLASTAGTYPNFGSLALADGEIAILKYNGAWAKDSTGAASLEKVNQLGQKVDEFAQGKFYGYFSDADELPAGDVPGFAYVGTAAPFAIYNFDGSDWSDSGLTINEIPIGNGEDIDTDADGKLQFANRSAAQGQMGYKILRKDATFAAQVTEANTIYEIRYAFDLGGASVTIPAGCVLKFVGGHLSNGTIVGQDTMIEWDGSAIFSDIAISGTWASSEYDAKMFADVENENVLQQAVNLCNGDGQSVLTIGSDLVCLVSVSANEEFAIAVPANTTILLDGTIQLKANSLWGYKILYIAEDNVTIKGGGKIWGDYTKGHDFSTYQGEGHDTHEWGRGITIWGAKNVTIDGIESGYCTGDAFNVGQYCEDLVLTGIYGHTSRRQGITIANVDNLIVENFVIESISGTNPQSGIDIEPDNGGTQNIIIRNGEIKDCMFGVIAYQGQNKNGTFNNIKVSNVHFENLLDALSFQTLSSESTYVVDNITYKNISRLLLSAASGTEIIANKVTEIYDDDDDFPEVIINARSNKSVLLSHFYGRCRRDWYADTSFPTINVSDSKFLVYENKAGSYGGIHLGSILALTNCSFIKQVSNCLMNLSTGLGKIENCQFDISVLYIRCPSASMANNVVIRNNYIKTDGGNRVDHIGLTLQEGFTPNAFFVFEDNVFVYNGSSYAIGCFQQAFVESVNNTFDMPNSTLQSVFNNVPTQWNNKSRGLKKGSTANRPVLFNTYGWVTRDEGYDYFDMTLRRPVWWQGTQYVDALGIVNNANVTAFRGTTDTRTAMTLTSTNAGLLFYDETLKAWTLWNGSAWTYADGEPILAKSGTTRPTGSVRIGYEFFDETLGKPIWYKGNSQWVDATGTVV